jgi:hypothetical protein
VIRRLIHVVGEGAVYGIAVGFGTASLYAAFLAAKWNEQTMLVGLLLVGVAVLVLIGAVTAASWRQPEESAQPLPAVVEDNMARPRPHPSRRGRQHPTPAHTQLSMPLRRPRPEEATTVVLDMGPTHVAKASGDPNATAVLPRVRRGAR